MFHALTRLERSLRNACAGRRLPAGGRAILLLLGLQAGAASAGDPDNCLLCHQYRGLTRYDADTDRVHLFFVDPTYVHALLGPHARLSCTDCHVRDEVAVIPHEPVSPVDCTKTCHLADEGGLERRFTHADLGRMLSGSVHAQDTLAALRFAGGPLLEEGQSLCLYCHDEPVFRTSGILPPALGAATGQAFDRCNVCHAEQIPVDVAYYLRHISARLQLARPPLEQAQVCAVCHADPAVIEAAGLTNAVAGFVRSFHGKAALLGYEGTPSCVSCHVGPGANAHLMFARTDPRSSVAPQNVADTCRSTQCHPGAEPQFAAASVHLDLPRALGTLEFGIAFAFIALTILTFGPSLVLTLLELFQIVLGRHHEGSRAAQELVGRVLAHPQGRQRLKRFTLFQRYQHWVLVLLFVTLAVTGFPMKFAERPLAKAVVDFFGGLQVTRLLHHWAGIALVLGFLLHAAYGLGSALRRAADRGPNGRRRGVLRAAWTLPMLITPADIRKGGNLLLYLLGLRREPPTWGRFTIKEKFEYIGVFWGTTLLGLTGMLLWGEQLFSQFITGRLLNIALIAHTYEAFLAIIHVGILHIVNVIFAPHVFPLSLATITGDTPRPELAEAHREYVEDAARDLGVAPPEESDG